MKETLKQIDQKLREAKEQSRPGSEVLFYEQMREFYGRALTAQSEGKPLVAYSWWAPLELFYTMDLVPFMPEWHAIWKAPEGLNEYMDRAEGYGITRETCSAHRAILGMAMAGTTPRPDVVVCTAQACDTSAKMFEILSHYHECPYFLVDSAYRFDDEAIAYYRSEMLRLVSFLEEHTGHSLEQDRLLEVCQMSEAADRHWFQISELRKSVPTPVRGSESMRDCGIALTSMGTPGAVEYMEERHREIADKVARKEGAIPEEKHRILWVGGLPYGDLGLLDWMEEEYGAVVTIDSVTHAGDDVRLDPEDPLGYIIRRTFALCSAAEAYRPISSGSRLRGSSGMYTEYHADGVICFAHWGCKATCGMMRIVKDGIQGGMGIPTLILDGDYADMRIVSDAQMKVKLREFFALLDKRAANKEPATP